jgi:hypothetical protein
MNGEQKQFLMNIATDFKSVNELQDILQSMSALQNWKGEIRLQLRLQDWAIIRVN